MNNIEIKNNFIERVNNLSKRYLEYVDVSYKSQITYSNGINSFIKYINDNCIKNPTREDIIGFRETIKNNLSLSTTNTYMIAVRNFFKWLQYENLYKNITENVKGVEVGNLHKRNSLTQEQLNEVISNAKDNREKMIVLFTTSLGLRANEIVNVRLQDFKNVNGTICVYVLGKCRDGKVDYLPVNKELYSLLEDYIKEYEIKDYLFESTSNHNKGGKLTTKTIRYIVKNMFKRVGLDSEEYCLHSLRHTFATINLENGANIREVSQALRHKNIQTTEIYAHDLEMRNNSCFNINNILKEGGN